MPTVKTFTSYFNGQPFKQVFKVDGSGTFSSTLAPGMFDVLGYGSVISDTLEGCESAVKEAHKAYQEASTQRSKVILYQIKLNAYIWRDDRCVLNQTHMGFYPGVAVSVVAGVFTERKVASGDHVRYFYDLEESHLPKSILCGAKDLARPGERHPAKNRLDWTPELEELFCRVGLGLEAVILQLEQFDRADNLPQLAAQMMKALPAPEVTT